MEEKKKTQQNTQNRKQPKEKVKKIQKYALMSPYLQYYEVMPSKPSKDFVSQTLIDTLKTLHKSIEQNDISEKLNEPPTKRFKGSSDISLVAIKQLSKSNILFIGLNKVQKLMLANYEESERKAQIFVFVMNDTETTEICKHLVGFCRQFAIHCFILPKFLKKNCCEIMGTQKLTSFALKIEDKKEQTKLINEMKEFDNHPEYRSELQDFKYGEEAMFKSCVIKKWQVDINPKKTK